MERKSRGVTNRYRPLRKLAREIVRGMGREVSTEDKKALVTSLVRQWVTYDGHATLLDAEFEVHFYIARRPDGQYSVTTKQEPGNRLLGFMREWELDDEQLPDLLRQLNLGQSAEFTNRQSVPLRLWVNPKDQAFGIEPLREEDRCAPVCLERMARLHLDYLFGKSLAPQEAALLAASLVHQWNTYGGHAALLTTDEAFVLTLTRRPAAGCSVRTEHRRGGLRGFLRSQNLETDQLPAIVHGLNTAQAAAFTTRQGVPYRIWVDPKARQLHIQPVPLNPVIQFFVGSR